MKNSFQSELPTIAVVFLVYGSWILLMLSSAELPWWFISIAGSALLALHGSLQHEILHGHPTRIKWINEMLAWPPLSLWIPYPIYRESHIEHHRVERLTDPLNDPESYYFYPETWASLNPFLRFLLRINNTMLGRFLIGPWLVVGRFFISQISIQLNRKPNNQRANQLLRIWFVHGLLCWALLTWLEEACQLPWWQYVFTIAWPGVGLALMRSFHEHRPAEEQYQRSIIVEGSWFTQLLFLNNNFHAVHHEFPGMPWCQIRAYYFTHKNEIIRRNGGFWYRSYAAIARQFLIRPKDSPCYPGDTN